MYSLMMIPCARGCNVIWKQHPAAEQVPLDYEPRFVERMDMSKPAPAVTPIAAATAQNGATTVQTVMTVGGKGGKRLRPMVASVGALIGVRGA